MIKAQDLLTLIDTETWRDHGALGDTPAGPQPATLLSLALGPDGQADGALPGWG